MISGILRKAPERAMAGSRRRCGFAGTARLIGLGLFFAMVPEGGAAAQVLLNAPEGYAPELPSAVPAARQGSARTAQGARVGKRQQAEDVATQAGIQPLRRIDNRIQTRIRTRLETRSSPR